MLISIIPISALPAAAAEEKITVSSIEVEAVKPVIGAVADISTVKIKSVNGVEALANKVSFMSGKVYYAEVPDLDPDKWGSNWTKFTGTFESGKIYSLHFALESSEAVAARCEITMVDSDGDVWYKSEVLSVDSKYVTTDVVARASVAYDVFIGGVALNDGDYLAVGATAPTKEKPSGGYAYYSNHTLTLNNFTYKGTGIITPLSSWEKALVFGQNLQTIHLVGTNSLVGAGETSVGIGVEFTDLTVTADEGGSLSITNVGEGFIYVKAVNLSGGTVQLNTINGGITCGEFTVSGGSLTIEANHYGVYCLGDVVISDGNVTILSEDNNGICSFGGIDISGGSIKVTSKYEAIDASKEICISGGNIEAKSDVPAIESGTGVTISGGTVTAEGGDNGIYSDGGITISGGTVTAKAKFIAIESHGAVWITGGVLDLRGEEGIDSYYSVYIKDADITINAELSAITTSSDIEVYDSTVNAKSGGTGIIATDDCNIFNSAVTVESSDVGIGGYYVILVSSEITVSSNTYGIKSDYLSIGSCTLNVVGDTCAMSAKKDIEILCVDMSASAQKDGALGEYAAAYNDTYKKVVGVEIGAVVGGVDLKDGEYLVNGSSVPTTAKPSKDGYAYYKDGVLTLNHYSYEGIGYNLPGSGKQGIFSISGCEIHLIGTNTIKNTSDDGHGIYVLFGTVKITAEQDGVLNVSGKYGIACEEGNVTISSGTVNANSNNWYGGGIAAGYDLNIEGGSINVTSADNGIYAGENLNVSGGSVSIKSKGDGVVSSRCITISGGNITVDSEEYGIYSYYDVIISGGTLDINTLSYGMYITTGDLTVTGGKISIEAEKDGVYAYELTVTGGMISIKAKGYGIDSVDDTVISGGIIDIDAGKYGITSYYLTVSGGTVNVVAGMDGLFANYDITISNGALDIVGEQKAIHSDIGRIILDGVTLVASTTVDGEMSEYVPADNHTYKRIFALHTCVGIKQDSQAATCTEDGWLEYYSCVCSKTYHDAECTSPIPDIYEWKSGEGRIAAAHIPNEDDGDCTTSVTCSVCGEDIIAAKEGHEDTDNDGKCDACGSAVENANSGDGNDNKNSLIIWIIIGCVVAVILIAVAVVVIIVLAGGVTAVGVTKRSKKKKKLKAAQQAAEETAPAVEEAPVEETAPAAETAPETEEAPVEETASETDETPEAEDKSNE